MLKITILLAVLAAGALGSVKGPTWVYEPTVYRNITNGTREMVESPNFPRPYPVNKRLQWEISCPPEADHELHFKCPHFALQSSPNCLHDRLIVTYRGTRNVLCGSQSPNGTVTETGWTRLTFFSNADTVAQGFRCYIWCHAKAA